MSVAKRNAITSHYCICLLILTVVAHAIGIALLGQLLDFLEATALRDGVVLRHVVCRNPKLQIVTAHGLVRVVGGKAKTKFEIGFQRVDFIIRGNAARPRGLISFAGLVVVVGGLCWLILCWLILCWLLVAFVLRIILLCSQIWWAPSPTIVRQ